MATHSSILVWRIPGMEEPGGLPSVWLHRIGHDWSDLAAAAAPSRGPVSLLGYIWLPQGLILIPFRLPQISCFVSALNVSPLTQTLALMWGLDPCFSSPICRGLILVTLLFFPQFLRPTEFCCDSIYSFLLVRYSCLLSPGILHGLLCLKVYSWWIHGERWTPHPTTPPPSCSLPSTY